MYDVGNKSYSNQNDKQKALDEIVEKLSTSVCSITKLGHNQLAAVVSMITLHDATQLDATGSEMFRSLRLAEKPTKSVIVQLSRAVK